MLQEQAGNYSDVLTSEDVESLNWERLAGDWADAIIGLRQFLLDKVMWQKADKKTLVAMIKARRDFVLKNQLVPLTGVLLVNNVTRLILRKPTCLGIQKSVSSSEEGEAEKQHS